MNRYGFNRYMHTGRRGYSRRQPDIYATLLLMQLLERIGNLENKPPVTVSLIALNFALFWLPSLIKAVPSEIARALTPLLRLTETSRSCLNPARVLNGERGRLVLSSFIHLSDLHVIYNMSSFLYKGVALEAELGSFMFIALITYLSFTAHVYYVAIAVLANHLGYPNLMNNCVAGFSGVLFGLKVIMNFDDRFSRRAASIFGVQIPGGSAHWAELFLASFLMPNVSFLGHLCGILAGLTYIAIPKLLAGRAARIFRNPGYQAFQGRPHQL